MMEASDREVTLCGNAPTIRQFLFAGMSSTIFRAAGFRFFFFSREEARPPVHVSGPDGEAEFWLEPTIQLAQNFRLDARQLRAIEVLIRENENAIRRARRDYFER